MKASLLARAAPVLLLAATLAGGAGVTAFAQTVPAPAAPGAATQGNTPSDSATTAAPATTTHHATTTHARQVASRPTGETMVQMAEQRIRDLHASLHITSSEQPQWEQFAQVMRDNAKDIDQAYQQRAAHLDSMNAVDNMQSYAQIEQTRTQDLQKLVPAFQTLYASLSDEQKMEADQLFRNRAVHAQQHRARTTH